MLPLQPYELFGTKAGLLSSGLKLLAVEASLLDDGLELVLCPPCVLPHRLLAPLQVVDDLLGGGNLRGAAPAAPDAAVPDAAVEAGTAAPDVAGLINGLGACAAAVIEVAVTVVDTDMRPDPSAAASVSVVAAGAGVPVPTAVAAFDATTEAGVPAPVVAAGVGTHASAATVAFATASRADVPASATAPVAGAGVLASPTAAVPVVAMGVDSLSSAATDGAARFSSTSSSRSITPPVGGPLGAMPYPAGSVGKAKGGAGVEPCPMPVCGTTPPVAAVGATSAVGFVVSLATPPRAAGGVAVRPAEVDDTRSAFFGSSGGMRPRGAAL
ncbi:elastin-like [Setaria italica]|uniref:elastin-like n=1 Tax=Setaria italica TaxID=4555 RepID=UPI0007199EA3|nr:elastin-like [Setaria italica]